MNEFKTIVAMTIET